MVYITNTAWRKEHKDAGFRVLRWGSKDHDTHANLSASAYTNANLLGELSSEQLASKRDIIPAGFKSERNLSLLRDDTGPLHYSY